MGGNVAPYQPPGDWEEWMTLVSKRYSVLRFMSFILLKRVNNVLFRWNRMMGSESRCEHFAGATAFHLLLPTGLDMPFANGSVDEPAEFTGLKLPCRTLFFSILRTVSHLPTENLVVLISILPADQKQQLSFNMDRNISPPLFIAVNGFDGGTEQLGHLSLGFPKLLAVKCKICLIQ